MASGSTYCFFAVPLPTAVGAAAPSGAFVPASLVVVAGPALPIVSAAAPAGVAAVFAADFASDGVAAPVADGFLSGSAVGDELAVCAGPCLSESDVGALLQPATATIADAKRN